LRPDSSGAFLFPEAGNKAMRFFANELIRPKISQQDQRLARRDFGLPMP
jgi:hypothetical protein